MYELGQAIGIVVIACLILYTLRKPLARLFGVTERKAGEAQQEMRQAYDEGLEERPTPKEEPGERNHG